MSKKWEAVHSACGGAFYLKGRMLASAYLPGERIYLTKSNFEIPSPGDTLNHYLKVPAPVYN